MAITSKEEAERIQEFLDLVLEQVQAGKFTNIRKVMKQYGYYVK